MKKNERDNEETRSNREKIRRGVAEKVRGSPQQKKTKNNKTSK